MTTLSTALVAIALACYILYRQCMRRPVTRRDYLLPAIGGLYLASRYLDGATGTTAAIVLGSVVLGILTGAAAGGLIRVWRDDATGLVYQFGGWRYAGVVVGLIVVRLLMRAAAHVMRLDADDAMLNDAFIAMAVDNYLGRALNVGVRALALVSGDFEAIPRASDAPLVRLLTRWPDVADPVAARIDLRTARAQRRALRRARRGWEQGSRAHRPCNE